MKGIQEKTKFVNKIININETFYFVTITTNAINKIKLNIFNIPCLNFATLMSTVFHYIIMSILETIKLKL